MTNVTLQTNYVKSDTCNALTCATPSTEIHCNQRHMDRVVRLCAALEGFTPHAEGLCETIEREQKQDREVESKFEHTLQQLTLLENAILRTKPKSGLGFAKKYEFIRDYPWNSQQEHLQTLLVDLANFEGVQQ